ncbi:MAG: ABC transporter ATP-binding protein [Spirochaetales bacterium]
MSDHQRQEPNRNTTTPGPRGGRGPMGGPGGGPMGGMGRPVEKAMNFKPTLNRLLGRLKPFQTRLVLVFILATLSTIFTIGAPQIIREAMNKMQDSFMAKAVLDKMAPLQLQLKAKVTEASKAMMAGGATAAPAKMPSADQLKAIKTFMALPLLADTADNAEKARIVRSMLDSLAQLKDLMPATSVDGKAVDEKTGGMSFTQAQVDDTIRAIEKTGGHFDFAYLAVLMLLLGGVFLLSALFTLVMQLMMAGVAQKLVSGMRSEVNNKLDRLPLKFFDSRTHGEVLSRVTNDIDTIANTLQQSLTQIITSIISIVGYIIMMLTISPLLTLFVMLTLPLYIVATMFIAKKSQKYFADQQKELGALSSHVEEMFTGHKVVKAFGREGASMAHFEEVNGRLYHAGYRAQFISGVMFPMMNFISNLGYVVIAVVGGMGVTQNWLKLGDITAFIQYARNFTMPIIQTANIANIIQSTIACAERVFEILDETEESAEPAALPVAVGHQRNAVRIENASFRYKEDTPLIENMNLNVEPGHTVAIVGPTGAGKTTLVNLLMRFYELNSGTISLGGKNIHELKRSDLRGHFGMVLQDTWLFNGTIRDNIAYGKLTATEDEIVAAAKAAHADHFIRTLPDGYNTVLDEEASNISQGQKQLLTIARAVLADPDILILDEATSSVDTRTEVLIRKAMENLMADRTSFVIAHRLSTIRDAELILVMDKGSIIEQGTHVELLAKKGFYAELYQSQFAGA